MVIEITAESRDAASSADGSTKALLLPKIDANRGRERDTRHVVCSDGDGKDCPVESLAFILTAAHNRLVPGSSPGGPTTLKSTA